MHIYKINILFESDGEDLAWQQNAEEALQALLKDRGRAELVSSEVVDLPPAASIGRCATCGAWVSDYAAPFPVRELSSGVKRNGKWLCDLCVPENDPDHF